MDPSALASLDPKTAAIVAVILFGLKLAAGRFPALASLLSILQPKAKTPATPAIAAPTGPIGLDRLVKIRELVSVRIAKLEDEQAKSQQNHDAFDAVLNQLGA